MRTNQMIKKLSRALAYLVMGVSAAALVMNARGGAAAAAAAAKENKPAPAWQLKDVEGKPVNSEDFKGKVVVLDFWATWCGPCREEIPGFVELQKKYGPEGLVVVG